VNCSALPPTLIESELFGHEKGAFTGAYSRKIGRFELADRATIFLDEIGELPPELQAKLLRVLQEGEFEPLGTSNTKKVDVRFITATNRDLRQAIKNGKFRKDLYYRLSVFPIEIPPLRERKEDIPLLARHFARKFSTKTGKQIESIPQKVIETLMDYHWPGNIREMENVIERGVILSRGRSLTIEDLAFRPEVGDQALQPPDSLQEMEKDHILRVLRECNWIISGKRGAALRLGLPPSTLRDRMKKLEIEKPD